MANVVTVLEQALKLPAAERGRVVTELIRSLDDDPTDDPAVVEAAWGVELQARAARARGEEPGVDLDTALADIAAKRGAR